MGILDDEFYGALSKSPIQTPLSTLPGEENLPTPSTAATTPRAFPDLNPRDTIIKLQEDIPEEKQIERFGGPVGSEEYYRYKADHPFISFAGKELGSAFGIRLPEEEVWDKMTRTDQIANVAASSVAAGFELIRSLPKEIVKAPIRVAYTTVKPWSNLAKGKPIDFKSIVSEEPIQLPWLGTIPTYFQTYDEARKSGLGPLGATLFTGSFALGDVTVVGSIGEALAAATRPRFKLKPGEKIKTTEPIQRAFITEAEGLKRGMGKPTGSVSEYYSLPKTLASEKFGGSSNNTFLKVTPASADSVELSVVQVRSGKLQRAADYFKDKLGKPTKLYDGDFGPEVKLQSQIIKIGKESPERLAAQISEEEAFNILASIPPKPLKGFENKPVTQDQLVTLDKISQVNGLEPALRDSVIRTVTGKSAVGELTQAEFVRAAQTLSTFNKVSQYVPQTQSPNLIGQYASPQRHWMRSFEESSGIPVYSEVYVPMEEGIRLRNVFRDSYREQARKIFGKYAGSGFGEERRLVSAYMRGEKEAITANVNLSATTKEELIQIANSMREIYDKVGPVLDVPTEIFLKDYQPRVQNIGGVYQLYKEGSEIPKQLEFFAKFKRKGSTQGIQIDDALSLFDIYINSGSNKMFIGPNMERISAFAENLPPNLKNSVKSYVFEKIGYAGRMEQFLDSFVPNVNKKLGINLPPDAARQVTNLTLSTMYSGLLSSPATWFRQTFQYPLFGYARLGPKFSGEAITKGLSTKGIAETKAAGFLVDLGVPYGEELAKDITLGGEFLNTYKNVTQKVIMPNSFADNGMRSIVYHQAKMQFDDALARYNAGKITWQKLEQELDFGAFTPTDRNIIRERLVAGDIDRARNHFIQDIIDDTNFPYRKGSSSRIGYGLAGKLGTSLLQWPIEAAHTLGRWIKGGQWDKIIRYVGASHAINESMRETFGFDFRRSFFLGPFNNFYSPFARTALDFVNGTTAFLQNNREEFNKNKDSILRTLQSGGIPAGVAVKNVLDFWRSYNKGVNADGKYAVLNDKGEVRYFTDFAGLFWGELMGFPLEEGERERNLTQEIRNAQFDRTQVKNEILELLQREKYEEASKLMQETGVTVGPGDMDDYFIPYNQRVFRQLPSQLKARFAPSVFPDSF